MKRKYNAWYTLLLYRCPEFFDLGKNVDVTNNTVVGRKLYPETVFESQLNAKFNPLQP